MDNSVDTIVQLQNMGFDYGPVYNSLFWVALALWSFFIAHIILSNLWLINKLFAGLVKIFIGQKGTRMEHIIVDQTPEYISTSVSIPTPSPQIQINEHIVEENPKADREYNNLTIDPEVEERVKRAVEEELKVSRVGQMPDEFSEEDFAVVDFDGVNPDDDWHPRDSGSTNSQKVAQLNTQQEVSVKEVVKDIDYVLSQLDDDGDKSADTINTEQKQEQLPQEHPAVERAVETLQETFKDEIILDKSGEYPKIVLTRSVVDS